MDKKNRKWQNDANKVVNKNDKNNLKDNDVAGNIKEVIDDAKRDSVTQIDNISADKVDTEKKIEPTLNDIDNINNKDAENIENFDKMSEVDSLKKVDETDKNKPMNKDKLDNFSNFDEVDTKNLNEVDTENLNEVDTKNLNEVDNDKFTKAENAIKSNDGKQIDKTTQLDENNLVDVISKVDADEKPNNKEVTEKSNKVVSKEATDNKDKAVDIDDSKKDTDTKDKEITDIKKDTDSKKDIVSKEATDNKDKAVDIDDSKKDTDSKENTDIIDINKNDDSKKTIDNKSEVKKAEKLNDNIKISSGDGDGDTVDAKTDSSYKYAESSFTADSVEVTKSSGTKQNFWKKLSKKAKAIIVSSSAIILIALVLMTTFLSLARFDIKVKSPADFIEGKHNDKAYTYVVKGDIDTDKLTLSNGNSLDLNKNILTINGVFTQVSSGEWVINYGDAKGCNSAKHRYEKGGLIKANEFYFDSTKSVLNIYSDMQVESIFSVKANVVNIYGKITGSDISIEANEVIFHNDSEIKAENLTINNAYLELNGKTLIENIVLNNVASKGNNESIINSNINTIRLIDSQVTISSLATVDSVELVGGATLKLETNVKTGINGVNADSSNLTKVIAKGKISIPKVSNINSITYDFGATIGLRTNVENVFCRKTLEVPKSITIAEQNGKFYCHISTVIDASAYVYLLNGEQFSETASNYAELPLNKFLKPGTHIVEVYATGKDIVEDDIKYEFIDSGKVSISHIMTYTLSAPDVQISPEGSSVVKLSFNKVDFADYYIVTINGKDYKEEPATGQEIINIDITDRINFGQNNAVEIVAYSNQPNAFIKSSKTLLSYLGTVKLDTPTVVMEKIENPDTIKISWENIENAISYGIFINDLEKPIVVTNDNSYVFDLTQIKNNDSISVKALKNNYYKGSNKSNGIIYKVINLDAPEIVIGNSNKVEFKGVENAVSYDVFVNDSLVTTITAIENQIYSYNFSEELNNNDIVKIVANNASEHYNNENAVSLYTVVVEDLPIEPDPIEP